MALDSREKRASAVMVTLPWRNLLPLPDPGAEGQADRQQVGFMAASILADTPFPGQPPKRGGGVLWWARPIAPAGGAMVW